eukprot:TRINITY_DN8612_c0_g6_i1.p1 TRINITY_DN8612_c0_g6~~TRINITY_DN8612_c0_g6_i1.p1  ORF type:complete len:150 (+),score=29.34 TRINITY_DN8612_c0_g6_i1:105-554(+)
MWQRPPPEVSCASSSVEAFYRGAVAGGMFGVVFGGEGTGLVARLMAPVRPAFYAGTWCLFTSFASCVLTRAGVPFPWNGACSGLFSGSAIAAITRVPRDSAAWLMGSSAALSVMSHYAAEGAQGGSTSAEVCAAPIATASSAAQPPRVA